MRALLCLGLAACALTSKAAPIEIRYFSPPTIDVTPARSARGRVQLGRITSSSHLRYRIVHRRSAVELELSDSLRWTEQPEDYVRRAVSRALFVERGIEHVLGGDTLTLSIEVTAFDHVERAGRHFGCVQLHYQLDDDRSVVAENVITIEREAQSAEIARIVAAIGEALRAASTELAGHVVARLDESH